MANATSTANLPSDALNADAKVMALIGFAHGVSHFFHLIVAPLFFWLGRDFSLSNAELGLLMSGFFIVSGIGQFFAGFVVDKFGARRVLFFGLSCFFIAALGLANAQNAAMLMIFTCLAGLGNSVFHPVDYAVLNARVSAARIGYAYSVHGITGNIGWAAAPMVLAGMATNFGWRAAFYGAAFIALSAILLIFINRHLVDDKITASMNVAKKSAAVPVATASSTPKESSFAFMRLPAVWICMTFLFVTTMAMGAMQSFGGPALQALYSAPQWIAVGAVTIYMLAGAIGLIAGGYLVSNLKGSAGPETIIAVALGFASVCALVVASGAIPVALLPLAIATIGLAAGIAGPSRDMLIRSVTPKGATGRVYGVVYSGLDAGLAVAPFVFGVMMDQKQYGRLFVGMAIALLAALSLSLLVSAYAKRQTKLSALSS
jgi:MFS transporter, FSR family, fosmidomycin resistance protein